MKYGSRKSKPQKRSAQKKGAGDHGKKAKSKKTNTRNAANVGTGKKRPGQTKEDLIYKDLLKASGNKVKVNDLKTGRIKWIPEYKLDQYTKQKVKQQEKKQKQVKRKIAKLFDVPERSIESSRLYDSANSVAKIEKIISVEKRLRYNGKFISKEAQEQILKFAAVLDREGVEYTLTDLLKFPEIEKKILVIKDKTPKHLFYWNLQNRIHENKFGHPVVTVIDYDGKTVFEGKSYGHNIEGIYKFRNEKTTEAVRVINNLNKRLENMETLINEMDDLEPYFTIPVYETTREGEVLKITIDYSGVEARIPDDLFFKYKQLL